MRKDFNAFTLAEVLITLGIIGVVAALTLPVLIAKYQQKAGIVGFKKTMTVLNQAAAKTVVDLGYIPECYKWLKSPYPTMDNCISTNAIGACTGWGDSDGNPRPSDYAGRKTECEVFADQFFKNLKVIKNCGRAYYDGCTVAYKGSDTLKKENDDSLSDNDLLIATAGDAGLRAENLKRRPAVVLEDGQIILGYRTDPRELIVDVNGKRGPNKWGYDIFRIQLKGGPEKGLFYMPLDIMPLEKGGLMPSKALLK